MTLAGLMEVARAVKMHLQNMCEQSKFDDVFTTVETKVKELELDTLSLPRKKDHQHVLVDFQRRISQQMYANISG